ncbi:hypothetical protein SVAN01_05639 [Stagonosporopsis vannaccii]|nr:hypothetical protein SVAN01_05639 [Stagonosporopsis vannaccii]
MGQYSPRLAAIRLSSVESRSRPQLRIALRPHGLAAASGPRAGVAFTVMATIGAPVVLAEGLASQSSHHTPARLIGITAFQHRIATAINIVRCASRPTGVLSLSSRY